MSLDAVFESGRTLRYHANPKMAHFNQSVADHGWGVAALLMVLNPTPSLPLLKAAIFHDCGERWVGDLPYPFKVMAPKFAEEHARLEVMAMQANGIPSYQLTEKETKWLKLCDRLEAFMFCRHHRPELTLSSSWQDNNNEMLAMAKELGCQRALSEVIEDARREG